MMMRSRFALYVQNDTGIVGIYESNSLFGLFIEVIKHRFEHLIRDRKWMD